MKTCSEQLIEAYEMSGMLTVEMDEIPLDRVVNYGIVSGKFLDDDENVMQVSAVCEKQSTQYARNYLAVKDRRGHVKYYCLFG